MREKVERPKHKKNKLSLVVHVMYFSCSSLYIIHLFFTSTWIWLFIIIRYYKLWFVIFFIYNNIDMSNNFILDEMNKELALNQQIQKLALLAVSAADIPRKNTNITRPSQEMIDN